MKILVACEFSDTVSSAFRELGHDVTSCDLLPSEGNGKHIQGDVRPLLQEPWDLVIAHPPCSYLCHINEWFRNDVRNPNFQEAFEDAIMMFKACLNANAPKVAVENPQPSKAARERLGAASFKTCPSHLW